MTGHRVLVFGGRDFYDGDAVNRALDSFRTRIEGQVFAVIHGGARGADSAAGRWARQHGLPEIVVNANWDRHGKAAGSMCNQWMLDFCHPTYAIAFPGGPGTRDMTRRCAAAGIAVWEPRA